MDVLAIERRDEGAVEPGDDGVGDLVGLVLQHLDELDRGPARIALLGEQLDQSPRGLDRGLVAST